jgi:hypothetical protein
VFVFLQRESKHTLLLQLLCLAMTKRRKKFYAWQLNFRWVVVLYHGQHHVLRWITISGLSVYTSASVHILLPEKYTMHPSDHDLRCLASVRLHAYPVAWQGARRRKVTPDASFHALCYSSSFSFPDCRFLHEITIVGGLLFLCQFKQVREKERGTEAVTCGRTCHSLHAQHDLFPCNKHAFCFLTF